ncbi:MAG: 3'(2'),5'-bisphosphate nucleotidase CysQ [Verrucomicrobiae bacterium]|nr:3'(2'),5'-bisphosphate nucleotidase CysQ [Verrucomicrobiae bacterium]
MTPGDQRRLTDAILPAVFAAARIELQLFQTGCAVGTKADCSPVTEADVRAEAVLLEALAHIMPGVSAVSEEAFAAGHRPVPTDPFLLIDPLDGTKQFVAGFKEFTINIAVISGGRPVYGLIYAPALADLMVTDGGRVLRAAHDVRVDAGLRVDASGGAAFNASSLADTGISLDALRPHEVRARTMVEIDHSGGLVVLQSRSRDIAAAEAYLSGLPVIEQRRLGSSYKFCLVACGEGDIYAQLGDTSEWDTAAGEAIVLAAGGTVAGLDGEPLTYGHGARNFRNPPFVASSRPMAELRSRTMAGPAV